MPVIPVPYPRALDYAVQGLQQRMYNWLKAKWGIADDTQWNCYGRAYRNKTTDGYIPEVYNPDLKCYVSSNNTNNSGGIFYDDRLSVVSFFGLLDPIRRDHQELFAGESAKMELLFFVNLSKITPSGIVDAQGQRLDDVCINDVTNYIQSQGNNFEVIETYRDIDKVLERYSGEAKKDSLVNDMHPKFCFKIILTLKYNPLINNN